MKLYLDTSALNRPFDDTQQVRIYLEAMAMRLIFTILESQVIELIHSDALIFEVSKTPYPKRRNYLELLLKSATLFQSFNPEVTARAERMNVEYNIKGLDALHLACAEVAGADCFITCDDRLTKRYRGDLTILNPVDFVMQLTQEDINR